MPAPVVPLLVVGNACDGHFLPLVGWLAKQRCAACVFAGSAADAVHLQTSGALEPRLIVLLQSRPGEFTAAEVAALRRRWPLARLAAVFASWCEGESRSGRVADGVYRIAWDVAEARLARELPQLVAGRGPLCLPGTATFEERHEVGAAAARPAGLIAVAARRRTWAEPLVEALGGAGARALFWPLDATPLARGATGVVWDTTACEHRLAEYRGKLPPLSAGGAIVALADFPRPQDRAVYASLGVRDILGKPLALADLVGMLAGRCAMARPETRRVA